MTQPEQYIDKSTDAGEFELADPPLALKRSRRGLIRDGHEAKGGHD